MATQARIEINGVPGSDDDLPINTLVQLNNLDLGGELTYLWSILDQPLGTADALSNTAIENPTFTPKKEGSYLLQLIVNFDLPDEQVNRAIVGIRQLKTRERIPAAGETNEDDTARGWATTVGNLLQRIDALLSDPGSIVGANTSGSTLTRGDIVRATSGQVIKGGLPGQESVPGFTKAPASVLGNVDELLCIIEGDVFGNTNVAPNGLANARFIGRLASISLGSGAVGDPVYVSDTATISTTSGTYRRQIGSIMAVSGGLYDIWCDGVGGADITPIDRGYMLYGAPSSGMLNAHRFDGSNATPGALGGVPYLFKAGDTSTIALVAKGFTGSTQHIQEWRDASDTVVAWIAKTGTFRAYSSEAGIPAVNGVAQVGNANGVRGTGFGSSAGVQGLGSVAGSPGVTGIGGLDSPGVYGVGGATNGTGVQGFGVGNGTGVYGRGGLDGSTNVCHGGVFEAVAGNTAGLVGVGHGSGAGLDAVGGTTSGSAGVVGTGGSGGGNGVLGRAIGVGGNGVYGEGDAAAQSAGGKFVAGLDGNGVEGVSSLGHGVVAQSDTTSPAKAALRAVPQDADPTTASMGDVYVNSTTGLAKLHNGSGWKAPRQIVYSLDAPTSVWSNTSVEQILGSFAIPANALKVGTTIHIEGLVYCVNAVSGNFAAQIKIGGTGGILLASITKVAVTNTCMRVQATLTVVSLGSNGAFNSNGVGLYDLDGSSTLFRQLSFGMAAFDTTVSQQIVITGTTTTANGNNQGRGTMAVVEIEG